MRKSTYIYRVRKNSKLNKDIFKEKVYKYTSENYKLERMIFCGIFESKYFFEARWETI